MPIRTSPIKLTECGGYVENPARQVYAIGCVHSGHGAPIGFPA